MKEEYDRYTNRTANEAERRRDLQRIRRQREREKKIRRMRLILLAAVLALVCLLIVVIRIFPGPGGKKQAVSGESTAVSAQSTAVSDNRLQAESTGSLPEEAHAARVSGEVTISAAGDCTLGVDDRYNTAFTTYYKQNGPGYFLENAKPVFSRDDFTIVNFEGTLTDAGTRANKRFTFKAPASYTEILKQGGVDLVTLANNHSMDYGTQGFEDTKNALSSAGIPYCYETDIVYQEKNGIKTAFLGFSQLKGTTREQVQSGIDTAKKNGAHIIIVSIHWGVEKQYEPTAQQKELGHYAIDCGASLVLGHHPHVLEGIETYQGRQIVYSLGNFCFGGNSNPSDKDTMIFQQTFRVKDGVLEAQNTARIIPFSLSSSSSVNDFKPMKLEGSKKQKLIDKMNKLCQGLGTSIDTEGNL